MQQSHEKYAKASTEKTSTTYTNTSCPVVNSKMASEESKDVGTPNEAAKQSFGDLGVCSELLLSCERLGFKNPTKI
jgi:hypothetical protein